MDEFFQPAEIVAFHISIGRIPAEKLKKKFARALSSTDISVLPSGDVLWRKIRTVLPDGTKHGKKYNYSSTGQVEFITKYKNGVKHGKSLYYEPDGVYRGEEIYEHGKLVSSSWI